MSLLIIFLFFPNNSLTLVCAASKALWEKWLHYCFKSHYQIILFVKSTKSAGNSTPKITNHYRKTLKFAQKMGKKSCVNLYFWILNIFSIVLIHQALSYFLKKDPPFNNPTFLIFYIPYTLGLYRTSRPVRKSGKFSKSGLSRNRTFSFPDARLLTLSKTEKKNLDFLSIFKSPVSGKENVQFPDSPGFDNLPDFRTGRDVRYTLL